MNDKAKKTASVPVLKTSTSSTQSKAASMLTQASVAIRERGRSRDKSNGDMSMNAAVTAFNAIHGHNLTESDGWMFMALLKASRSAGGEFAEDDYMDGAAYFAIAGACKA